MSCDLRVTRTRLKGVDGMQDGKPKWGWPTTPLGLSSFLLLSSGRSARDMHAVYVGAILFSWYVEPIIVGASSSRAIAPEGWGGPNHVTCEILFTSGLIMFYR
jgi:hypothetical protein